MSEKVLFFYQMQTKQNHSYTEIIKNHLKIICKCAYLIIKHVNKAIDIAKKH